MKRWIHSSDDGYLQTTRSSVDDRLDVEDIDFRGWNVKDLKFYYNDNVDSDEYPTFIDWTNHPRKIGKY